jgi:hypothetical protein
MDRVTAFILRLAVTAMIAAALSFAMRAAQAAPPDMPPGCLLAVSHASPAPHAHAGHGMATEVAQIGERTLEASLAPSCCTSPCMNALVPPAMPASLAAPVHQARGHPAFTLPPGTEPDRLTRPPALFGI